jgi:N-methylhydantoinase A
VTCQVSATLPLPQVNVAPVSGRADSSPRSRPLMVGGIVEDAAVFDRASLMQDRCYSGPTLVEEPTATTLVLPGQRLSVDRFGSLVIEEA